MILLISFPAAQCVTGPDVTSITSTNEVSGANCTQLYIINNIIGKLLLLRDLPWTINFTNDINNTLIITFNNDNK